MHHHPPILQLLQQITYQLKFHRYILAKLDDHYLFYLIYLLKLETLHQVHFQ